MTKTALLFFSFCLTLQLFSQEYYIKGRITDEETQQPLKGASVYINNTTKGVVTNDNGEFELGPLDPGRYEVIASYVGYTSLSYSAEIKTMHLRVSFRLAKKEEMLRPVLVLSDDTRRRYLELFKQYVLGTTEAASKCKIKNIDEIQFTSGKTKDEIGAYTETELVIENPELGYTVYLELLDFYYNKQTSGSYFYGYTRFVDWGKDDRTKKKWIRKRKDTYEGSTVHFFRSLIDKKLESEKFSVYQLISMSKNKKDSSISRGNVMQLSIGSGTKMAAKAIEDSLIRLYSDSAFKIYELRIGDGWRIIYAKNTALKNEMAKRSLLAGQPQTGTITGLRLREAPVLVSEKGILLTPVGMYYDYMWSYERLANMLPGDYEPG